MKINKEMLISKFETYQAVRVKSNGNLEKFFSKEIGHHKAYEFEYVDGIGVRITVGENKILVPLANIAQIHYTEVSQEGTSKKERDIRQEANGAKVAETKEVIEATKKVIKDHEKVLKRLND